MDSRADGLKLIRKLDRVFARVGEGTEEKPVTLVWARPVSGMGREVLILDHDKKEILMIESLDSDPESRKVAEQELELRYLVPKITRITKTSAHFGNRYWDVETTHGKRHFVMKDPNKSVTWITDDHLIIRDSMGNCYQIKSFSALDEKSRDHADRVL